jgi:hypothetical protein
LQSFVEIRIPSIEVFLLFLFQISFSNLLSPSFNFLLQVPPFVEGLELIEQSLLEKKFEKVFSLFISIHDIDVL